MTEHREEFASLLLVDDDPTFCKVLSTALEKRGYAVTVAHSVENAIPLAKSNPPEFAVVDLKMGGAPGLALVRVLHELDPNTRIVVLTGYASIATAVEAIKLGATQYLAKPANADEIVAAFSHSPNDHAPLKAQPTQSTILNGNTSSACCANTTTIFRPPHGHSICIAALCNANWRNHRCARNKQQIFW
jgi:two-component system response regulator RegA